MNFLPRAARRAAGLCACALLASCTLVNPAYDPALPHHRPDGFQNRYTAFDPKGLGEVLRWRWQAFRQDLPPPPQVPTPQVPADLAFLRANATAGAAMQPAVTWLGHATVLVQAGGLNVLTDPVFSERVSPVSFLGPRRVQPPGLAISDLPRIDLVLVSHNHYDHLDTASVQALNAQTGGPPLFVVPLGLKAWLADHGITHAVELDWWQSHALRGVEIAVVPAQHWSGRGLTDRLATLWGGFVVFAPGLHWLYTGDTGYSRDFADIRAWLDKRRDGGPIDLALIPVGAYEPRWFMTQQHVNPAEAVQIHRDLAARQSIGVHWGTFNLTDEALDAPPRELAAARRAQGVADDAFVVLAIGETRQIPARAATAVATPRNSATR